MALVDVDLRIAQSVRDTAAAQGVTQVALAETTGIPRVTLIRRLTGRSSFTVNELARIAAALGVEATDFLAGAA